MGKYITIEQRCLLNINTILIEGRINDHTTLYISEALKHFYEMFRYRKDPEKTLPDLNIKINSTGGSYRESLFIFHLLEMYDGKTTATVEMLACSGAAVILQACKERRAYPYSKILIHNVRPHSEVFHNSTLFRASERKHLQKSNETMFEILMEKTGKSFDTIKYHCNLDVCMSSKEALEFGLIDKIIPSPLII